MSKQLLLKNRPSYLKGTTATPTGFVTEKGEVLKKAKLDEEFIAEWNNEDKTVDDGEDTSTSTVEPLETEQTTVVVEPEEVETPKESTNIGKKLIDALIR